MSMSLSLIRSGMEHGKLENTCSAKKDSAFVFLNPLSRPDLSIFNFCHCLFQMSTHSMSQDPTLSQKRSKSWISTEVCMVQGGQQVQQELGSSHLSDTSLLSLDLWLNCCTPLLS